MSVGPRRRRAVNCTEKERANMAAVSNGAKLRSGATRGAKWPIVFSKIQKPGLSFRERDTGSTVES